MANQHLFTLFLLSTAVLILSCGKDEVVPFPVAKFSVDHELATINETLQFASKSRNAIRYEWDFGDGTTSDLLRPTHSYAYPGTYKVVLKAYNSANEVSDTYLEIIIGERTMQELWLKSSKHDLPPNIFFFFGEVSNPEKSYFAVFPSNITVSKLPWGGKIDFYEEILLTDKSWFWKLIDNQPPLDTYDENDRIIFQTAVNPARAAGENRYYGTGEIIISETRNSTGQVTSDYEMMIGYTIK